MRAEPGMIKACAVFALAWWISALGLGLSDAVSWNLALAALVVVALRERTRS